MCQLPRRRLHLRLSARGPRDAASLSCGLLVFQRMWLRGERIRLCVPRLGNGRLNPPPCTIGWLTKCYDAAGGDSNGDFAKQFNCLSFGVWFWVTLAVWAIYWIVVALLRQRAFAAYEAGDTGTVAALAAVGGGIEDLWTVVAVLAWQIGFFAWLRSGLAKARGDA